MVDQQFNAHYYSRTTCRLCESHRLELVIPLGESPISEKYVDKENVLDESLSAPLDLYFCLDCAHVQLTNVVDPSILWSNFTFETGRNDSLVRHFEEYGQKVVTIANLDSEDLIVDVGSNDGTLLKAFKDLGFANVLGVDPADEIVKAANERGITTLEGYMDQSMSRLIQSSFGQARVITANNVYAHVDDLIGMTNALKELLSEDGVFVFEASYLLDIVHKNLIGTIFHEHLSYHSVTTLVSFFRMLNLELFHVERGPEQGGSIVGYVQHANGDRGIDQSVIELLELEEQEKLCQFETVRSMYTRLESMRKSVVNLTQRIIGKNMQLAGFGAARAGTTLLSYFGIGQQLTKLFDDNQDKHYLFSPGDRLEVRPTSEIYLENPDYLLILAWIHADRIIESHKEFIERGGVFIRLFPDFELITQHDL